ncbi:MAG: hypothetical protein H8D54_04450 [Candidatus Omnitrophica bacterium]|nr:hypothetical protein [Candidatus Omnitrophota bacterium]
MKTIKLLLVISVLLTSVLIKNAGAAPVGLISEADALDYKKRSGKNLTLGVGFIGDFVTERKMEIDEGAFEMREFGLRTEVGIDDKLNFFLDVGRTTHVKFKYNLYGERNESAFDEAIMLAAGVNALLYRAENGLEVGSHASYREVDLELTEAIVAGTLYNRGSLESVSDGKFREYQLALEVAWRADKIYELPYGFVPYMGVKYSDADIDCDFTVNGLKRDASASSSENLGFFVGITIIPRFEVFPMMKDLVFNIEGRWLDETAVDISLIHRF